MWRFMYAVQHATDWMYVFSKKTATGHDKHMISATEFWGRKVRL